MAHAKTYHWYKEELGGTGNVSIKFANNLGTPLDNSNPEDVRAALRYQDFLLGVWANAIFLGQNYPEEVLNTTDLNLTRLTDDEVAYINGTADIWSFDPYTAGFVTSPPGGIDACASNSSHPLWPNCVVNTNVQSDGWLNGQASMTSPYIAPQYVRQQFGYVWNTFKPKGMLLRDMICYSPGTTIY
jgi:beta-glucosidase/6-phospho-beta-glucosidase/beta-galactosidase